MYVTFTFKLLILYTTRKIIILNGILFWNLLKNKTGKLELGQGIL